MAIVAMMGVVVARASSTERARGEGATTRDARDDEDGHSHSRFVVRVLDDDAYGGAYGLGDGAYRPSFMIRTPSFAAPEDEKGRSNATVASLARAAGFELDDDEAAALIKERFPDADFSDDPVEHPDDVSAPDEAALLAMADGNETAALGGHCGHPSSSCRVSPGRSCPSSRYCYYGSTPKYGKYNQCRGGYHRRSRRKCSGAWFWKKCWTEYYNVYDSCRYRDRWSGHIYTCGNNGACVDCAGAYGGYGTCDAPCGIGRHYKTYRVSRYNRGYGSKTCPISNGYKSYKSCSVRCPAPSISIGERVTHVASNSFDFNIKINHQKLCGSSDCFASTSSWKSMVKCDARIQKRGKSCSRFGANMPCKLWTDFSNPISLTNEQGLMEAGHYELTVACQVIDSSQRTWSTKSSISHSFQITAGCNPLISRSMSATDVNSEIAKYLMLTSEEFLTAQCDELFEVKENVFRTFDVAPTDGILTLPELTRAMTKQGADPYILRRWDSESSIKLSLGQVMQAQIIPSHCTQPEGQRLTFTKVVYPSVEAGFETSKAECKRDAGAMTAAWKYGDQNQLGHGDTICIYIDGVLFAEDEPKSSLPRHATLDSHTQLANKLYLMKQIVDKRPVFGGFKDVQPSLVAQFTFDVDLEYIVQERLVRGHACVGKTLAKLDVSVDECMETCESRSDCRCVTWNSESSQKCYIETGPQHTDRGEDAPYSAMTMDEYRKAKTEAGMTSTRIMSSSPMTPGQRKRPALTRLDGGSVQSLVRKCNDGEGGKCIDGYAQGGYLYTGEQLSGDITFSTWMQVKKSSSYEWNRIVQMLGHSGVEKHELILEFNTRTSTLSLRHVTKSQNGVSTTAAEVSVGGLTRTTARDGGAYSPWYLVGFRLTYGNGATVFAYPSQDPSSGKTATKPWTRGLLSLVPEVRLFNVYRDQFQFDDVRFYTGNLGDIDTFFENTNLCGRDTYCAERARATPASRRVVCISTNEKGVNVKPYMCTGGMYYDGTTIDTLVSMDMAGVTFSFRDTAWDERGFEIERRRSGAEYFGEMFSTAVLVEADLKGCASMFNSITYIDRDAGNVPNSEWLYRITAKRPDDPNDETVMTHRTSPSFRFTTPWMTAITGRVLAGTTDVPVPYVRICSEFDTYIKSGRVPESFDVSARSGEKNIAQFKRVTHSSTDVKVRSTSYLVTDSNVDSGAAQLVKGEYLKLHLAVWASIGTVRVCIAQKNQVSTSDLSVFVSDADPKDSGNFGIPCLLPEDETFADRLCVNYLCKGAELTSLHGEHVVVKADSKTVGITEIEAVGNETRCKYTDVTDKDGEYELLVTDDSGKIPTKAKLHIGAYREEVFPATDEMLVDTYHEHLSDKRKIRQSKPSKLLLTLTESEKITTPPQSTEFYTIKDVMPNHKEDDEDDIPRENVERFIAQLANLGTDSVVIIPDVLWSSLDLDDDDIFNSTEWKIMSQRMQTKSLFLEPIIVFPSISARRHHEFTTKMMDGKLPERDRCENFVLYRTSSSAAPSSATDWRSLREDVFAFADITAASHCRTSAQSTAESYVVGDEKFSRAFMLPLVVAKPYTNSVLLDRASTSKYAATSSETVFDDIMLNAVRVQLHATHQLADIAHVFNKPPQQKDTAQRVESNDELMANIFSDQVMTKRILLDVKHKRIEEKDFTDDTTAVVTGAVLFPKSFTEQSSDCGLPKAEILVFEPDKDPDTYETDDGGWFELALPRGKTFTIRARYKTHTICYAGATVEDAVSGLDSCKGRDDHHTIKELGDGETLFFSDFTESKVDLGVFQGECDALYTGAKFRVTPVSGCHAAATFTSEDIAGKWSRPESEKAPSRIKVWPFAAINYNIELLEGSSVDGYDRHYPTLADDCQTEPGSMVDFFRNRDTLVRLLRLQDEHGLVEERYKYHGYICVSITDVLPIKDGTTCWDKKDTAGGLTSDHFIGTSEYPDLTVPNSKMITAKVFELHMVTNPITGDTSMQRCFQKLPNPNDKTGSTKISFRQDVTDEGENECHHNRGGGPMCDFQVSVDEESGLLNFPRSDGSFEPDVEVIAGAPNFAHPYRRKLDFTIERFDNYFTVSKLVTRPMVTLGSQPRAGEDVRSDDVKWATVPIEGLVYTVVHDPPGGNSFAELQVGSTIGIQFDLSGTRAAGLDHESASEKSLDEKTVQINPGYNLGYTAEGNMNTPVTLLTVAGSVKYDTQGPKFDMTSRNQSGWSLETTTDRVIRSSTDVSLAGRAGDVILGGGIELLYRESDILDVQDTQNGACLVPDVALTWLPRKPTSYLFSVASVEMQVVPNLKYLLSVVRSGGIAVDGSGMYYECADDKLNDESVSHCTKDEMQSEWTSYLMNKIDTWTRTLDWASPRVYYQMTKNGKEKVYDAIDRVSESLTDGENALRESFMEKINTFNDVFFEPMDDITKQLSSTWDASYLMMPRAGTIGPPPMLAGFEDDIETMEDFFEPESGDPMLVARITGSVEPEDSALDGVPDALTDAKDHTETAVGAIDQLKKSYEEIQKYRAAAVEAKKKAQMMAKYGQTFGKSTSVFSANKRLNAMSRMTDRTKAAAQKAREVRARKEKLIESMKPEAKKKAKSLKTKVKKSAKANAAKVLAGGLVMTEYLALALELKGKFDTLSETGYQYVSFPREAYRDDIPEFEDVFFDDEAGQGLYTWGMLRSSAEDLTEQFVSCDNILCDDGELKKQKSMLSVGGVSGDKLGEDFLLTSDYSDRVVASFTGGVAQTGMRVRGQSDTLQPHSDTLLLTFSGGGTTAEYTFSSSEKLSEDMFSLGVSVSAKQRVQHELELGGPIGMGIAIGMSAAGRDLDGDLTFNKYMNYDRSFAWNKHGRMSTMYSLGDPEIGDKFVVRVGADKRFGTPIFTTMGGRSSCPGEPLTVWRESGYELKLTETPLNLNLNPTEPAIVQLTIQTGTMYRESPPLGLRLVDGVASSVQEVMKAALAAYENSVEVADASAAIAQAIDKAASSVLAAQSPTIVAIKKSAADAVRNKKKPSDLLKEVKLAAAAAPAMGTEMNDVEFSINGVNISPLGAVVPLEVLNSDLLNSQSVAIRKTVLTVKVKPASVLTRDVNYMQMRIQSLCESGLSNLNRDPISSTAYLQKMSWSQRCPRVEFDASTMNQYGSASVSRSKSAPLKLKVFNPDREVLWPSSGTVTPQTNERLASVKVQYRVVGKGEWISAKVPAKDATSAEKKDSYKKNLLCAYSRGGGCPFDWDVNNENEQMLSGFKDGIYEVRAKSFCVRGDAFADASVHESVSSQTLSLLVDTVQPLPSSKQFYAESSTVSLSYFEPIDCSAIAVAVRKVFTPTCAAVSESVPTSSIKRDFTISCSNAEGHGKWIMQFPRTIHGTFEVKLQGVKDIAGNCEGFSPTLCEGNTFQFTTPQSKPCSASGASNLGYASRSSATFSSLRSGKSKRWRVSDDALNLSTVHVSTILLIGIVAVAGAVAILSRRRNAQRIQGVKDEKYALRNASKNAGYGAVV